MDIISISSLPFPYTNRNELDNVLVYLGLSAATMRHAHSSLGTVSQNQGAVTQKQPRETPANRSKESLRRRSAWLRCSSLARAGVKPSSHPSLIGPLCLMHTIFKLNQMPSASQISESDRVYY
ncbi:hypothetical protein PSPO01_11356 [Paraphaeosphaeria sporulosa]